MKIEAARCQVPHTGRVPCENPPIAQYQRGADGPILWMCMPHALEYASRWHRVVWKRCDAKDHGIDRCAGASIGWFRHKNKPQRMQLCERHAKRLGHLFAREEA